MDPTKLDVNKTTIFLLPMLFPDSTHDEIFSTYFRQAHIGLLTDEMPTSSIVLEFDEKNITEDLMDDFINHLEPKAYLVEKKDNLIFFDMYEEHRGDYENFLQGKYSKFNYRSKQEILEFWKENKESSLLKGILDNDPEVIENHKAYIDREILHELEEVDDESWPPPDLFVEEFLVP